MRAVQMFSTCGVLIRGCADTMRQTRGAVCPSWLLETDLIQVLTETMKGNDSVSS
jgi:hypothetical protein